MCWPVIAAQSGPVHAQFHVQVLDRDVVGTLEKRGVNGQERLQSLRGEATREKRRVLLRDTNIEVAARMRLGEMRKPGPAGHRRCDCDKLLICLGKFREGLAENFRVGGRWCRRGLAALNLIFAETMELIRLLERRLVSFA